MPRKSDVTAPERTGLPAEKTAPDKPSGETDPKSTAKNEQVPQVGLRTVGNPKKVAEVDGSDERVKALVKQGLTEDEAIRLVREVSFF